MIFYIFIIAMTTAVNLSCYSLNGISIPVNVSTYYVNDFKLRSENAPPLIDQIFTQDLVNKINSQTKLVANNTNPDIEFTGEITNFRLQALAPTRDQESSLNRLSISVSVEYINNKDEEAGWKQTFSQNFDFGADQDLLSIQDQAIADIFEQIIEQLFNKAFANW